MRLPSLLPVALAALLMLASCASLPPPATALPKPLPAEYATRCPPPAPAPSGPEIDPVANELKQMYDLYGTCAGRFADLLDYLDGGAP